MPLFTFRTMNTFRLIKQQQQKPNGEEETWFNLTRTINVIPFKISPLRFFSHLFSPMHSVISWNTYLKILLNQQAESICQNPNYFREWQDLSCSSLYIRSHYGNLYETNACCQHINETYGIFQPHIRAACITRRCASSSTLPAPFLLP